MRKFLSIFLVLMLLTPAAMAASEPSTLALKAVTYYVEWTYCDGFFAQVALRQVPNDDNVALVDASSFDAGPDLLDDEMNAAAQNADRVIGSYCEVEFVDSAHPEERPFNSGSSVGFDGRGLSGEARLFLAPEAAPNRLEAWVTVGVRTEADQDYTEMGSFTVPMPKIDSPVLDVQPDLDMGLTRVERVVVSHTPNTLVVRVIHKPFGPHSPSPFVVAFEKGEEMQFHEGITFQPSDSELGSSINTFWLDADEKLPTTLRLTYHGAEQDLLVKFDAGLVTLEAK